MSDCPKAPCVGENVVWYPHGDINQEPFAAIVVSRLNENCITLYTLSPSGRMEPKLNVKHVNNPDHENSPEGLRRWGSWDLIGEHEKRKEASEKRREESLKASKDKAIEKVSVSPNIGDEPDEIEKLVIDMSAEMGDIPGRAALVAEKIKGGMTHQRVNAILRRFPLQGSIEG